MKKDFAPIAGESLHGLLARWCAANHFDRMIDLTGSTGLEHPHRQTLEFRRNGFETIARETGLPAPDLVLRSTPLLAEGSNLRAFYGAPVAKYDLDLRRRRFAPAGLAKSPHHRALWQVRVLPACIETMQYLTSICPRCGSKQGWHHTIGVDLCDRCIRPLANAPGEAVPPHLHDRLKLASSIIHPDPDIRAATLFRLPREIADLGAGPAFDLLVRLMPVADQRLPLHRQRVADAPPPLRAQALAAAWDILSAWPDGFARVADERLAARTRRHSDGNRGATTTFLASAKSGFLLEGAAGAIRRLRDGLDIGVNERLRSDTLTTVECARLIGREQSTIARLRSGGHLTTVFAIDKGTPVPRIPRIEMEHISATLSDRLTIEAARIILGISCHGIEQLASLDLLKRLRHPFFEARYGEFQLSANSVESLVASVEARSVDIVDGVQLSQAAKCIGGRLKPWGSIFAALLDGSISCTVRAGTLPLARRIMVPLKEVERLARLHFDREAYPEMQFARTMSKVDAGEALNVSSKRVTDLLSMIPTVPGTRAKTIPVDYVERLARDHATSVEFGARLAIPAHKVAQIAHAAGVRPVSDAGYPRSEMERLFDECHDLPARDRRP